MHWIEGRRSKSRACLTVGFLLTSLVASAREQLPAPTTPAPPNPQQQAPPQMPAAAAPRVEPRFVVVIDAAHGGTDDGARLSGHLLEKDLVLALSVRLRSMLSAYGLSVITTRESDTTIPAASRAELADHTMAAACITLHATNSGIGVHLFTSSLTPIALTQFMPWETAQGAYTEESLRLSSELNSAMTHAEIPVTLGRTALQPLDSFTCPAVAVEVAPPAQGAGDLSDSEYQNRIVTAMAAALEQWQRDWRQQP